MNKGFMRWMKITHPEILQQYANELKNASEEIEQHLDTEHEHVVPERKRFGWI